MLDTVIFARDKWLEKGGYLLPDRASLNICGIEDEEYKGEKFGWWERVWGFDMSTIKPFLMVEPVVDYVEEKAIATTHCSCVTVDLYTIKKEELDWKVPFRIKGIRNDFCHALVVYFDIWFTSSRNPIHFSTGPHVRYTHWKQTVFYLEEVLLISDQDEIIGTIAAKPNSKNPRDLDISIHYICKTKHNDCNIKQTYFLR